MLSTRENPKIDFSVNQNRLFSKVFWEIQKADRRYVVVYGGASSSKSYSVHQAELIKIMHKTEKGDTLFIRKNGADIRESCFKLLEKLIKAYGLGKYFRLLFSNDQRKIIYTPTGRAIIFKGIDDSEKLKSIVGVKRIVIEEANQLNFEDFMELDRRARGLEGIQLTLILNPIVETHWIKLKFCDAGAPYLDRTNVFRFTYKDNVNLKGESFLTQADIDTLESLISISPNNYRVYALGEWGMPEVQRPYVYNFNQQRTISTEAKFNPALPIHFSIDFNVEPFVCICAHIWGDSNGMHYHIFKELVIEKNGDVYKMLELIAATFTLQQLAMAVFTGDAMQRKREITQRNNLDAWRIIDAQLKLGRRLMVPRANPSVKDNRHLVNAICAFHPDLKINPECKKLIYDLQFVEADEQGDIIKRNRNKEEQRSDALDTFRYQCNTHLRDFYERMRHYGKTLPQVPAR